MADATAVLAYRDPKAALGWLQAAFGFEPQLLVSDSQDRVVFARLMLDGASVGLAPEDEQMASPLSAGRDTQMTGLRFAYGSIDLESHCARAEGAGARIVRRPRQEFYGDLAYLCADPEGHLWEFSVRGGEPAPPPAGWAVRFPAQEPRP